MSDDYGAVGAEIGWSAVAVAFAFGRFGNMPGAIEYLMALAAEDDASPTDDAETRRSCPVCGGDGYDYLDHWCSNCGGSGLQP